jgi:hypothetical protein
MRHEVRDAGIELVDVIVWIRTHIHQLALTSLGILTVLHRRYSPLLSCGELYSIGIRKTLLIRSHRTDLMRFVDTWERYIDLRIVRFSGCSCI